MRNLSINEQKQVIGGKWVAVVYTGVHSDIRTFKTEYEARSWAEAKRNKQGYGSISIREVED